MINTNKNVTPSKHFGFPYFTPKNGPLTRIRASANSFLEIIGNYMPGYSAAATNTFVSETTEDDQATKKALRRRRAFVMFLRITSVLVFIFLAFVLSVGRYIVRQSGTGFLQSMRKRKTG